MRVTNNDNPFVGLRPFESDESLLFFGRQEQTMELLQRLHQHHFVGVVGGSGCGKSSLTRAGLVPRLKAGFLVNEKDRWLIPVFKPGEAPLYNLSAALLNELKKDTSAEKVHALVKNIKEEGADAIISVLQNMPEESRTNLFILVDQFEELFRFSIDSKDVSKKDEAIDFVNILLELSAHKELPVYVVITMRSDFIGDCSQFYGLPEALNKSQYLVPRLTRVQLKNAIEGPVRLFGGKMSPALTSRLLNEVQTVKDELPLLQHVLMRTWDHENKTDHNDELDLEDYTAVGGIQKALSVHADEALNSMSEEEKLITRIIFQALTTTDHGGRKIRRPAHLSELVNLTGAERDKVNAIINHFNNDRRSFLVINKSVDANDPLIDISHESLIRQWETLSEWVDEETESAKTYLRLSEAAALNSEGKKDLIGGTELQVAQVWKAFHIPNATWASRYNNSFDNTMSFLKKSITQSEIEKKQKEEARKTAENAEAQKKDLKRTKKYVTVISVFLVIAVIATYLAIDQRKEAVKKSEQANENEQAAINEKKIANALRDSAVAERLKISQAYTQQVRKLDTLEIAINKVNDNVTRVKLLNIFRAITANNEKFGSSIGLKQKYAAMLNFKDTAAIKNITLYAFVDKWMNTDSSKSQLHFDDCSSFIDFLLISVYSIKLDSTWGSKLIYSNLINRRGYSSVAKSKLAEGDLVFFNSSGTDDFTPNSINHIGIFLQNRLFLYFTERGENPGVKIKSIDDPVFWKDKFIAGIRFLQK